MVDNPSVVRVRLAALVLGVAAAGMVPPAQATFLTGTITGTVFAAGGAVPGVGVGNSVTGSYGYDDAISFNGILGPTNPLTAFSLSIGTNAHQFTLGDLGGVGAQRPGVVPGHSTPTANELVFFFLPSVVTTYFGGGSSAGQSLSNDPPQATGINNADPALSFAFSFLASPGTAAAVIPEPSSVLLGGIGILALVGIRRGRQMLEFTSGTAKKV